MTRVRRDRVDLLLGAVEGEGGDALALEPERGPEGGPELGRLAPQLLGVTGPEVLAVHEAYYDQLGKLRREGLL